FSRDWSSDVCSSDLVAAGTVLVSAERFSPWLYVFTATLALFLGFTKRRQELIQLNGGENHQRAILDHYNIKLLDEIILIVTAMADRKSLVQGKGEGA